MPTAELGRGLAAGVVAAVVVAVGAWLARRGGRIDAASNAGIGVVVAALWAIAQARSIPIEVVVAVAGIGVAGWVAGTRDGRLALVVAVPFAVLLAADASPTTWIRGVVLVAASLGALAAVGTDRLPGWGELSPVLYLVTVAGAFAAVPDTEEIAALLGAAAPVALLGWPLGRTRFGGAGAAGATAVLAWVVAVGGRGRPPSIIGAITCLGLLAAVPAGRWLSQRRVWALHRPVALGAVVVQCAAVLVASRGAGISHEMAAAVGLSAVSATISLAGAVALSARDLRLPCTGSRGVAQR
jgi:hypothetical protein